MINPATIDFTTLPSCTLADRNTLPNAPGIYFVLAGSGQLLYIGSSQNLYLRLRSSTHHHINTFQASVGVRIVWLLLADPKEREVSEQSCITHFRPILNSSALRTGRKSSAAPHKVQLSMYLDPVTDTYIRACTRPGEGISQTVERLLSGLMSEESPTEHC